MRRRASVGRWSGTALVLTVLATVWGGAQALGGERAFAASAASGAVNVVAQHSGRCLEVEGSSPQPDARVLQADCAGQAGALWTLTPSPSGGGAVQVSNVDSGKCLTLAPTAGAAARQGECTREAGADFRFVDKGTFAWVQPAPAGPALCLEVAGGVHTVGAPVRAGQCLGQSGTAFFSRVARTGNEEPLEVPLTAPERLSLTSNNTQSTGGSFAPSASADGRYVAFHSTASDIVPGDTNGKNDIFVRDRQNGIVQRVSTGAGGVQGNEESSFPTISSDGRYVAFQSRASNLVAGDTNGMVDAFVWDRSGGAVQRVSLTAGGAQGNGDSNAPSISEDGRYVAFWSYASNLVAGDNGNKTDVFVRDRQTGAVQRLSTAAGGTEADGQSAYPVISGDGRYVTFVSWAANLVPGDTNDAGDVFVRDRLSTTIQRVSAAADGTQGNGASNYPSISADGRYVAFVSQAANLTAGDTNAVWDVFVRDRTNGTVQRLSTANDGTQGNAESTGVKISPDGRYVSFISDASNLVAGDANGVSDVFVRNRQSGTVQRVTTGADGAQANGGSTWVSFSSDSRYLVFCSSASNLVKGDTNAAWDVFGRAALPS